MKWRMLAVSGILGAGLLVTAGWQARGAALGASPAAPPLPPARLEVAAEGRVVAYPGAEVKVGAERAGRLVRVLVQEGQAVRAGDLLAEIESEELRASLGEARAHFVETEAEVHLAELARDRRRQLFEERIVAVHDLDQAVRDLQIAEARRDTAGATVARFEAQLRKSRILAPISGTVTARRVDAGQMVEAGDAAFTLADLSRLRIEGEAHEADAGAVAMGAPVLISAEGFPGRVWKGRVEEIPDSVTLRRLKPQDPSRPTDTRILAVKVAFSERTPLRLGTTVELKIEPAPAP